MGSAYFKFLHVLSDMKGRCWSEKKLS